MGVMAGRGRIAAGRGLRRCRRGTRQCGTRRVTLGRGHDSGCLGSSQSALVTDDANPRAYLLAIDHDRLPAAPFRVSLRADCDYCESVDVSDLTGVETAPPPLSEWDRASLLTAAARHRVFEDNSFGGQTTFDMVDIVDELGSPDDTGFIQFDQPAPLTESDRNALVAALAPAVVRFVSTSTPDMANERPGYALLSIAEPAVDNTRLTIATNLWCGGMCGIGGANLVRRLDDGTWSIGETIGPQWIS